MNTKNMKLLGTWSWSDNQWAVTEKDEVEELQERIIELLEENYWEDENTGLQHRYRVYRLSDGSILESYRDWGYGYLETWEFKHYA